MQSVPRGFAVTRLGPLARSQGEPDGSDANNECDDQERDRQPREEAWRTLLAWLRAKDLVRPFGHAFIHQHGDMAARRNLSRPRQTAIHAGRDPFRAQA
jgi:hypothetical protein